MNRYDTSEIEGKTSQPGSASVDAASALSTEPAELAVRVAKIAALESELRKWRVIFDAVADPICVVRADFHVECANAAYIALFGDVEHATSHYQCFALDVRGTAPCVGCPLPETVRTG